MLHARKSYNKRIQDSANVIPQNEPVFILRGQDQLAPVILDIYVAMTKNLSGFDVNIADAVAEHTQRMRAWHENHGCKVADMDFEDKV